MSNPNIKSPNYCLPSYPGNPPNAPWLASRATSSSEYFNGRLFGSYHEPFIDISGGPVFCNDPSANILPCSITPNLPVVQQYVNAAKGIKTSNLGVGAYQSPVNSLTQLTVPFNPVAVKFIKKSGPNPFRKGFLQFYK